MLDRRVMSRLINFQSGQGRLFVDSEVWRKIIQFQRIKKSLGIFQYIIDRRKLGQELGISGRKTQRRAPFHDRFAKPQGNVGDAFFRFQMGDGVIIIGLRHAGNGRIKIIAASRPG